MAQGFGKCNTWKLYWLNLLLTGLYVSLIMYLTRLENPIRSTFNYKPSETQDTEQQNNNARATFGDDSYDKKKVGSKKPF